MIFSENNPENNFLTNNLEKIWIKDMNEFLVSVITKIVLDTL